MCKSSGKTRKNWGRLMSVTTETYQDAIHRVLQREFGHRRHAAKLIANLAGVSPRTAENWMQKLCAPQGAALVNLMSKCEAVDHEISRIKSLARGNDN
jgi:hypothetical protein